MIFRRIRIAGCWVWRWLSTAAYAALPHVALGGIAVTCFGIPAWLLTRPAPVWDGGAPVERAAPVNVPEPGGLAVLVIGVGLVAWTKRHG